MGRVGVRVRAGARFLGRVGARAGGMVGSRVGSRVGARFWVRVGARVRVWDRVLVVVGAGVGSGVMV